MGHSHISVSFTSSQGHFHIQLFTVFVLKIYSRISQNFLKNKPQIPLSFEQLFIGGILFEIQKSHAEIVQQNGLTNTESPSFFTIFQHQLSQIYYVYEKSAEPRDNLILIFY